MRGLLDVVQVILVTLCCSVCPKVQYSDGVFFSQISQILSQFRPPKTPEHNANTLYVFPTAQSPKGHLGKLIHMTEVCTDSTETGTRKP